MGAVDIFEQLIEESLALRGRCTIGVSGGSTPGLVFVELAKRDLDWSKIVLVQVDERVAPIASGNRNLVTLREAFDDVPIQILELPVDSPDAEAAVSGFLAQLELVAGSPPVLDIVHLGLGEDGHTASLVPGDPILRVTNSDVAKTGFYQDNQRLSMTRPILERARLALWLVRGSTKARSLRLLLIGDPSIPAGLLQPSRSIVVADSPAIVGDCL